MCRGGFRALAAFVNRALTIHPAKIADAAGLPLPQYRPAVTDVSAGQGFSMPTLRGFGNFLKRGDTALAFGVLAILIVLILPLPAMLLDFALAISIIFSILILMTSLFIHAPLEFSVFPTVL